MKKLKILIGTLILAAGLAGCSTAYYASSGYANDDLYSLHDKTAIARKQQAKAEAEKAAAEARRAEWEARIAEAQAAAAESQYYEYSSNPYEDIVARYVRKRLCTAPAGLRIADIQDAVKLL